jgi:hypothetical protein
MYLARQHLLIPYRFSAPQLEELRGGGFPRSATGCLDGRGASLSMASFKFGATKVYMGATAIPAIIRQVNTSANIGATACLRHLLSDNITLLRTYVDAATVQKFTELISDRGPVPQVGVPLSLLELSLHLLTLATAGRCRST